MKNIRFRYFAFICCLLVMLVSIANAQEKPKDATEWTKQANSAVLKDKVLQWWDKKDFQNSQRGFIGAHSPLVLNTIDGKKVAFSMERFTKFMSVGTPAPDTVNPSLWRHAQLNTYAGLFEITDGIYEVRGYDMANMIIIKGKSGYILIDVLSSNDQAQKAMELVYDKLGKKPIKAVIITHTHSDHFGGIAGLVSEKEVRSGKVKVIAGEGFTEAALSENVFAGPAMLRRAVYQFGAGLPADPKGVVDSGIGKARTGGTKSFMIPNDFIKKTGEKRKIDGVDFVFVVSPGTEAPVEIEMYLPQFNALCVSENVNMTNHNLYPMRGALTRDAKVWVEAIDTMMDMFPETSVAFGTHFRPVWGKVNVDNWLGKQRDMIKYMHDQTLRLANLGYTGAEISQMVKLPQSLASEWFNRDYYGTIQNNVRAIYTRYLGWYDGNVANLNPLPPEETAVRMVELMGGETEVIKKARQAFDKGEYRWVAQILNLVVFANPKNMEARNLEADALEQLGYQQESSTWRSAYLVGARELRTGQNAKMYTEPLELYGGMPEGSLFDALSVMLNGPRAEGKNLKINFIFPAAKSRYLMVLENSVIRTYKGKSTTNADMTITTDKPSFIKLFFMQSPLDQIVSPGGLNIDGNKDQLKEFVGLLDVFDGKFNIVLP